jgi:hypothetical protein
MDPRQIRASGQHGVAELAGQWVADVRRDLGLAYVAGAACQARISPRSSRCATHRVLGAHADQDGQGTHWLQPGEKCAAPGPGPVGQEMIALDAVATHAATPAATKAAEPEAGS